MTDLPMKLSQAFSDFFESEKSSAALLMLSTALCLFIANSAWGAAYQSFWQLNLFGLSLEHWVNDGLMAVFFLLIGLELERELYVGELSSFRDALLPIVAAIGGIVVPALIHYGLNQGSPTAAGSGIPMATDIAFAMGALSLLGSRVPLALKVFVTAAAVIDDLGAIVVIAVFYSTSLSLVYLLSALAVFLLMLVANRWLKIMALMPYLLGGALMWFLMLKSGIHATIAGVLLAFAIPFAHPQKDRESPSAHLEHWLHKPVAFLILPMFALANTGVVLDADPLASLMTANSLGIFAGLVLGKPLGIFVFSYLAVKVRMCRLPEGVRWGQITGAGCLAGIGFTMSIFITNLAFPGELAVINASKLAILCASITAGAVGLLWLSCLRKATDTVDQP